MLFIFAFFISLSNVIVAAEEANLTHIESTCYLVQLKETAKVTTAPTAGQEERYSATISALTPIKRNALAEKIARLVIKQCSFLNENEDLFELAIYLAEKLSQNPNFTKVLKRLRHFTPSDWAIRTLYKFEEYVKLLDHMEGMKREDLLTISRLLNGMIQTRHLVISYNAFLEYIIFLHQHMNKHPSWCIKLLQSQNRSTVLTPDEFKTRATPLLQKDTTERKEMLESLKTD